MGKAFVASKAALTDATHLAHPIQEAELSLAVDASNHHVGAALQQRSTGGVWQPLSFFSRKLPDTETRYSTFDRELLAVVATLHHFRFLLEGRKFHVLTNHKLSTEPGTLGTPDRAAWYTQQGRHLAYVAEFTSDLRQVAGADNLVADCLSRPPEELYLPRSTQVAGVKAPYGSQATPVARDGSSGASSTVAAVVPATQQGPIRWGELACDQLTCQETEDVLTNHTGLLLEMVVY